MRVINFQCPSCGAPASLESGEMTAECAQCGNPLRRADAAVQQQSAAVGYATQSGIRLGTKTLIQGEEFEITGRLVLGERDEEGLSQWEEWVLIGERGTVLYLELDEGRWKLSRPFVPSRPLGPAELQVLHEGSGINLGDEQGIVTGSGTYQVLHVEGEFPYAVRRGQEHRYLDAQSLNGFVSVEWSEEAVEFYRGQVMGQRQLYVMLGMRDELAALDVRERVLAGRRTAGKAWLGAALIALSFWLVSLNRGQAVAGAGGTVRLAQAGEEGYRHGPFRLNGAGKLYRLVMRGSLSQSSIWVGLVLEDAAGAQLAGAQRDMWDESGTDSDGYWHEADLKGQADFRLEKAGDYFIRVYAEPEPGRSIAPDALVAWSLHEGVIYPTYLGVYGLIAGVLGIAFLIAGSPAQVSSTMQALKEASEDDDD